MNELSPFLWLGYGIGYVGGMFLFAFLSGWCLKLSTKWVAKKHIHYWHCYWTEMITYAIGSVVGIVFLYLALLLAKGGRHLENLPEALNCASTIIGFGIHVGVVAKRVAVSPGKAALIVLLLSVLAAAMAIPAIIVIAIVGAALASVGAFG